MEYAGFKAATPIDWAKLTSGLTTTIQGIGEKRELERQELDKLQTENAKILDNTELGKSQTFNELILGGAGNIKGNLVLWNKQLKSGIIKPLEYRNKVNNVMSNWSTLAKTAKTFDQQMQETIKLQQEGKGSGFSLYTNGLISEIGDLKSKTIRTDPNTGNVLIGKLDDKGIFDPNSIIDVRTLSQPGNMIDNKLDLASAVDAGTKNIKSFVIEKGITTTTDPRKNPAVKQAMFDLAKSIASNPRAVTSVLVDNTAKQYDFYYKNEDLKEKLIARANYRDEFLNSTGKTSMTSSERASYIEEQTKLFIPVVLDANGIFQPNPTKEQQDEALKTVSNTIETRLEFQVELDEPQSSSGDVRSSESDSKEKDKDNETIAGYKATIKAWGGDVNAIISTGKWTNSADGADFGGLKGGYRYVKEKDEKTGKTVVRVYQGTQREPIFTAKSPKDLAQYAYGSSNPSKASLEWEKARKMALSGSNQGESTNQANGEGDDIFN